MANLTAEKARFYVSGESPMVARESVAASTKLYKGQALGLNSVSARALVAGDSFLGFADESIDNSSGSAGDLSINYVQKGVIRLTVTGVSSATAMGTTIYASGDDTFTTASTSNSSIGKLHQHDSGTSCYVAFEGIVARSL